MNNWKETTLDDAVKIIKDSWKPGDSFSDYIGLEHINEQTLTLNGVGNSEQLESNKFKFKSGDILFGKLRPYFRKVVMLDFGGVCSTDIWVMRAKEGFDQKYLFYFVANPVFINKSMGANTGTHMPRADWDFLKNTEWKFPSLPEQKQIAAVLSSLDDKIELLRKENETLEKIAQTIFKEWFVDFRIDGKKLKLKNGIPEGWRVGKIKELIEILSGFPFRSEEFVYDGKYKLVTIRNVQDGYFEKETKDSLREIPAKMPNYCRLITGDILLSLTGNVGRICHVIGNDYLLNQRVAKLNSIDERDFSYAYLFFRQKEVFNLLVNISSGTAQQNLSPVQTGNVEAILPNRGILNNFAELANPMFEKILNNLSQIKTLSRLRDTLLPSLMNGEIELSDL